MEALVSSSSVQQWIQELPSAFPGSKADGSSMVSSFSVQQWIQELPSALPATEALLCEESENKSNEVANEPSVDDEAAIVTSRLLHDIMEDIHNIIASVTTPPNPQVEVKLKKEDEKSLRQKKKVARAEALVGLERPDNFTMHQVIAIIHEATNVTIQKDPAL
ncbi:hypothetical protein B7494_g4985 [Chlorociboria aeruginascens]|nr:hypothetical protein B7494_g4985 [Chlorociboria aeruginascens]